MRPGRLLPRLAATIAVAGIGSGCAVATVAGAAASLTGAVVSTGVSLTGKAIGAGVGALTPAASTRDTGAIVVREHIGPAGD